MLIQCSVFESSDGGITKAVDKGQVSRLLYRGCPLFGGSVIRGFTVLGQKPIMVEVLILRKYINWLICR